MTVGESDKVELRTHRWIVWLKNLFKGDPKPTCEVAQARALIAAIDRGGIPLNTAKINAIARDLGLDVSRHAPAAETIKRIRQAVERSPF
jgi:hypothetical protein